MITASNETWPMSLVGISLSLFTVVNTASKAKKHKYDLLLILWLSTLNIPLLLTVSDYIAPSSNLLSQIFNPSFNLLQGPFLYGYVTQLINQQSKLTRCAIIHFVPFILFYILFACISKYSPIFTPIENMPMQGFEPMNVTLIGELLRRFAWVHVAFFMVYSIITIGLLNQHQKELNGYFSQKDKRITLQWIYSLPVVFVCLLFINLINESQLWHVAPLSPHTLHLSSYLTFIILLCFFGVKQKPIFVTLETFKNDYVTTDTDNEQPETELEQLTKLNHEQISLQINQHEMAETISNLRAYMENEKPYLQPDFSVYHLAEAMNIPRRSLSQVLSQGLHKNFFQYVNEYRIEEVKRLLNKSQDNSTILTLAFKAGFKSKSSFNSLFKQHCSMTPTQYRKAQRDKQHAN